MENITQPSYLNDPRRLSAEELLNELFSPDSRRVSDILTLAKELETHPGIGFFRLAVPYDIKAGSDIRTGFSETMKDGIASIVADLETMPSDAQVIVDIDLTRIPKVQFQASR